MFPDQERTKNIRQINAFLGSGHTIKIGVVLIALFLVAKSAGYTISSGTVGVLSTLGKISTDEVQPGFHFKIPFIQDVYPFDVKMQTINYNGINDAPDSNGVINLPAIEVLDNKNLPIALDVTIQFTPISSGVDEIVTQIGWNYFEKKLNALVRDIVRDAASKYQAEAFGSSRMEMNAEMKMRMETAMKSLPFVLNDVALRDIRLPATVMQKIQQVQEAKQEEQRLAMVLKQSEQNQKIKEIEAKTKLIEVTTAAQAEAERLRIESEGRAKATLIESEARAKANELISRSLTPILVDYNTIERWNGQMPQTALIGKDGIGPGVLFGISK